jgi:tight adherence protein C
LKWTAGVKPVDFIVMKIAIIFLCWFGGLLLATMLFRRTAARRVSRARVFEPETAQSPAVVDSEPGFLTRWLALAGYRSPGAARNFVLLSLLSAAIGAAVAFAIFASGVIAQGARWLDEVPGGVGGLFLPVLYGAPWLALVVLSLVPWLVVRSARRRRVTQVEQDLPTFLELLATLGESGIAFDAALERILSSQSADRTLSTELRTFQTEVLAGRGRIECLRRLARRVDLTAFSTFVSAVVQAEQIGAGMSGVLRRQSDDARDRRRERALQLAMSLPVKLLFPLIACFLPGIFVWTLGPTFSEFFRYADQIAPRARQLPTPIDFRVPPATTP